MRGALHRRTVLAAVAGWVPLVYLALALLSATHIGGPFPLVEAQLAAGGLVVIFLMASGWLDGKELRAAGVLLLASIGVALTVAFLTRFSLSQEQPPLPGEWTHSRVRELSSETLLWARQNPDQKLTIQPGAARWLGWSLRTVPLAVVQEGAPAVLTLAPASAGAAPGPSPGLSRPVGVSVEWEPAAGFRGWWRWVVQGRDWVALRPDGIILSRP